MGSATTQALATSAQALAATQGITVGVGGELFAAARLIDSSVQLSGALVDPSVPAQARQDVVGKIFATVSEQAREALRVAAAQRWSRPSDLIDGIEELAIRAVAIGANDTDLEGELFAVSRTVAENPDLELALGSRIGNDEAKAQLAQSIFGAATSPATALIVSSLVQHPRGRRVRQLLSRAIHIIATQREHVIATVHTAVPLGDAQHKRLSEALHKRYGTNVSLNIVIDPSVVGGLRVQVADDVIDGSISARLADLRQKLAG
ncbi:F0F1 ATP synthase subunit delta [Microbacterium sp. YY-01]|uniref:F0F1 ATP synthase subunit delta n=1 Tax=Microbacterium sp. YY-01 TaxID=3421634 RepID=UPI003D16BA95